MKEAGKQQKMFENPLLELVATSGPIMMISYHLILISTLTYIGYKELGDRLSTSAMIAVFISGMFVWTISEYLLHRYLFHWVNESKFVQKFHYALHGYHHNQPNDANRLFMPPVPATIFIAVLMGIFFLLMGKYVLIFFPGFELGYLLYSFMHYSMHTRKAPRGFEKLWHHHIMHHYKTPDKAYGVSSRFWDRVFNTMPD